MGDISGMAATSICLLERVCESRSINVDLYNYKVSTDMLPSGIVALIVPRAFLLSQLLEGSCMALFKALSALLNPTVLFRSLQPSSSNISLSTKSKWKSSSP